MFLAYLLHGGAQRAQVVDVRGVGVEGAGEGLRLVLVALVGLVEDVVKVGHFFEESVVGLVIYIFGCYIVVGWCGSGCSRFVEADGDGFAMFLQDRHGRADDLDLVLGQRHVGSSSI